MADSMIDSDDGEEWKELQILGQGGFGCVSLWQNKVTKALITIKESRFKGDMKEKMWERWKSEVYILKMLDHDNVIRAVELPSQLSPPPGDPPLLAMEFCEGGDLRKVLNRPENCHGLQENTIRQLVNGVGGAIEYLHGKRIIHRDLKPENIVLKHVDDHFVLYKIIDLGYAKELDMSSICNSFVGTVQYLAPELYVTKPYTKTVDYWSFGSLVFECITGFRPFLPTAPPVEWHDQVSKKSPDDISAQYDDHKRIHFSKKLPTANHLCKPLKGYFEQWLALMLRWDAKARGGGIIDMQGVERPKCFYLLEQILNLKILHILHVEANNVLSYPVNETHTVADVQAAIQEETQIPKNAQDIVLANGLKLNPEDLAVQGYMESNNDELILFLFRRGSVQQLESYQISPFPPRVQAILRERYTLLPLREQKKSWSEAVCWCCLQVRHYKRLISSHRAALLRLLRSHSEISRLKTKMVTEAGNLMACKEHFKLSLEFDMQEYQALQASRQPLRRGDLYQGWSQMSHQINSFNSLLDTVRSIEEKVVVLSKEMQEIQKSPISRSNPKQTNELDIFEENAKQLYEDLQRGSSGDPADIKDHSDMVDVVGRCFMKGEEVSKALLKHLGQIMDCQYRMEALLPDLHHFLADIEAARKQLVTMQQSRQADFWALVKQNIPSVDFPDNPNTSNTAETFQEPGTTGPVGLANIPGEMASMSSFNSNMESMRLMDDCKTNYQRLQDMILGMKMDQKESLSYMSSLESNK